MMISPPHFCRKALGLLAVIAVLLAAIAPVAAEQIADSKIIRILPLGDSITQGGRRDRPEYTYRHPLYYMLLDAGYQVDFIGSRSTGLHEDAVWPDRNGVPFDLDHEGHYGSTTGEIRDKLAEWLAEYPAAPDVVLIHLGSNDYGAVNYYGAIVQPLTDIVRTLRNTNPDVVILVGHLNEQGATPWVIRQLVEVMVYWINTKESPVETVDHFEGWVADPDDPEGHTFDHAHPNPRGQARMAQAWREKLTPHLDRIRQQRVSSR
jgi:acyl-CoA thioesterase-1